MPRWPRLIACNGVFLDSGTADCGAKLSPTQGVSWNQSRSTSSQFVVRSPALSNALSNEDQLSGQRSLFIYFFRFDQKNELLSQGSPGLGPVSL
ncbi:hypothetical protein DTO212C5_1508 [Paecilomyces variotii]|nr:hypothetical protein DTO212C5_1508 [Paecilomyces variotii]